MSGIHHVSASLQIPSAVTVTIAPCAQVQLDADLNIGVDGKLVANGGATQPITFVATSAGTPWGSLHLTPGATAELAYVTLTDGGGSTPIATSDFLGAALYAQGTGSTPPGVLKVSHVDVEKSTGVGVALVNAGFAPGSTDLTVHQSGDAAVYMGADVLDTLPTGTYTGNGRDMVMLQTAYFAGQGNQRNITRSLTIHDRGVPYCVGMIDDGEIRIGDPTGASVPLVTIEPGVALNFTKGTTGSGGRLSVDGDTTANPTKPQGALSAIGTATKPIKFGSCEATPAPGDWIGLQFTGIDARDALTFVDISNAGADSGAVGVCDTNAGGTTSPKDGDAALQIYFSQGEPSASFLSNSTITKSAGSGIYRDWNGQGVDFVAGNTVSSVAWCTQTLVPDVSNACTGTCPTAP